MLFESFESLISYAQEVSLKEIAKEMRPALRDELRDAIDKTVYKNPPSGSNYSRTYAMRKSADTEIIKENDGYDIKVFNNPDKMDYDYHSAYSSGNLDNRNNIVEWLNNGHGGFFQRPVNYKATNFLLLSYARINAKSSALFRKSAKKSGYKMGRNV